MTKRASQAEGQQLPLELAVPVKRCSKCGHEKPGTRFSRRSKNPDGLQEVCKDCQSAHARVWRAERRKSLVVVVPDSKLCQACKVEKPIADFNREMASLDGTGHCPQCRQCSRDRHRRHYHENPVKWKKYRQDYSRSRPDSIKDSMRRYHASLKGKFATYRVSAKQRGLKFSLTPEEFRTFWQRSCSYCGGAIATVGLDRIDSSQGYSVGNVVPCCETCNVMKNDHSRAEWLAHIRRILEHTDATVETPLDTFRRRYSLTTTKVASA